MADFRTHLMGAAVVSGVAATGLLQAGVATNEAVAGYFVLGVIGGLLPDIDSDTSIPLRMAFNLLAVVVCFLMVFHIGQQYSLVELTLLWLICFVAIRYGVLSLFTRITVHRGLIHSIPAGIIAGLLTTLVAYHGFELASVYAWTCGAFVFLGFMVHLLLDEFYSVDLMGMQIKQSFGTAFNLGSLYNPHGTLGLYLAIPGLFYLCPPTDAFVHLILNGETFRGVLQRLLPADGWFNGLFRILAGA